MDEEKHHQRPDSSPFIALPPEIRNDICERLLVHRHPIKITKGRSERRTRILLDVCRQLRAEYSSLYYHRNTFTFQCWGADLDREVESTCNLVLWLYRIGAQNRGMLQRIQIRNISRDRTFNKDDLFVFLRDQNVCLARETVWLPLSVLRVRFEEDWLAQLELGELIQEEEQREIISALITTGTHLRKGPDIMVWKRDIWDPIIDAHCKPGDQQLSEFVCPATWRYHTRAASVLSAGATVVPFRDSDPEADGCEAQGCLSGGLKILMAKMRKSKGVVMRMRRRNQSKE